MKNSKKVNTHVHTGTWSLVPCDTWYKCAREKAQRSTTEDSTTAQGTAPHDAALLSYNG